MFEFDDKVIQKNRFLCLIDKKVWFVKQIVFWTGLSKTFIILQVMKDVSDNIFFNVKEIENLSIPSKTVLLEEGKIADKIYLVRKGCLRLFFYNEGKDITFQFFFEGDFVASFDSLYRGTPSLFSLESIEPSEVVSIKKEDFYHKIIG